MSRRRSQGTAVGVIEAADDVEQRGFAPDPFGPISAVIVPAQTRSRSTPRNAATPPNDFLHAADLEVLTGQVDVCGRLSHQRFDVWHRPLPATHHRQDGHCERVWRCHR